MLQHHRIRLASISVGVLASLMSAQPARAQELAPEPADAVAFFRADEQLLDVKKELAALPKPRSRNLPLLFAANLLAPGLIPGFDLSGVSMTSSKEGPGEPLNRIGSISWGLMAIAADGLTVFAVQQTLATRHPQYLGLASAVIVHPIVLASVMSSASNQNEKAEEEYQARLKDLKVRLVDLEQLNTEVEFALGKAQAASQVGDSEKARQALVDLEDEAARDQRVVTQLSQIDAERRDQEVQKLLTDIGALAGNRAIGAEQALAQAGALLNAASNEAGQDERIQQSMQSLRRAASEVQEQRDRALLVDATRDVGRSYFQAAESAIAQVTPGTHASEIAVLRQKIEAGRVREREAKVRALEAQRRALEAQERARQDLLQAQLLKRGLSRWFPQRVGKVWSYTSGSASRRGGFMESVVIDHIASVNGKLCMILRTETTADLQIVYSSPNGLQRLGVIRPDDTGARRTLLYDQPETELPANVAPGTRWRYKSKLRTALRFVTDSSGHEYLLVTESSNVESVLVYQRGVGFVYGETYAPPPWGTGITRLTHFDGRRVELPYLGLEYQ